MEPQQLRLSDNGILYLSSGFDGPYLLQVIACRLSTNNQYHLCLTDGKLYVGAKYTSPDKLLLPVYSVVRVQCKFISRWSPVQVLSLEVVSSKPGSLLGLPPTTLHDYFIEQKEGNTSNQSGSDHGDQSAQLGKMSTNMEGAPIKKTKLTKQKELEPLPQQSEQLAVLINSQTQKIMSPPVPQHINLLQNADTQSLKFKSGSQSVSQSEQIQQIYPVHIQDLSESAPGNKWINSMPVIAESKVYVADDQVSLHVKSKNVTHNVYISDLYERMLRWKILCRVIHCRTFVSVKGKKCIIMVLIDQKGDQIKSMYYYNNNKMNPGDVIVEGAVYSFSGGQIVRDPASETDSLDIKFDYRSQFQGHPQIFISAFNEKRVVKLSALIDCYNQQVHVMGVLKSVQILSANESSYKPRPRIKGVLCCPSEMLQVEFSKTLYEGEKQPVPQSIYFLHGFGVREVENALKLSGQKNSFLIRILKEDLQHRQEKSSQSILLKKLETDMGSLGQWKQLKYTNLSQVKYSKRTVSQLKSIMRQTSSPIYTELLISVADIKLKKQYKACPVCKRSTIQQQYTLYQCLKCKKIVDPMPTIILSVVLADATGSLQVDVIGEKANTILEVDASEFSGLTSQQKQCTLQIAKFSQFVIRLRTEKKSERDFGHSVQEVRKQQHTLTMTEIRRRTVQKKLKLEHTWEQDL